MATESSFQTIPAAIKIGPCGGSGGSARDITLEPKRLHSIIIRSSHDVINSIEFAYSDTSGNSQPAGPWGATSGRARDVVSALYINRPPATIFMHYDLKSMLWQINKNQVYILPFSFLFVQIQLAENEFVREISGTIDKYSTNQDTVVTALKIVTDLKTYGTYGNWKGAPFTLQVLPGSAIVGMFARSGDVLDAIGVYVRHI